MRRASLAALCLAALAASYASAQEATRLTWEGLGPVRIGMTLDEFRTAAGPLNPADSSGEPGGDACWQTQPAAFPEHVFAMIEDGIVTRIDVYDNRDVRAFESVGIGATEDEVANATRNAADIYRKAHPYLDEVGHYLLRLGVRGPELGKAFIFETYKKDNGPFTVISFRVGLIPSVLYIEGCL